MPQEGGWKGNFADTLYEGKRRAYERGPYGGMSEQAAGRFEGSRESQEQGLGYYQEMIEGRGPSVAENQLRQQSDANIAASMQLQAQGRGGNMAAGQRMAGQQAAGQGMATNQAAATLRAQEQQAAMAGYAGVAGQMAQQDLASQMGYSQLELGMLEANDAYALKARELSEQERQQGFGRGMKVLKVFTGAIGSGAMASDINLKQNVQPLGDQGVPVQRPMQQGAGGLYDPYMAAEAERAAAQGRADLAQLGNYNFEYQSGAGPPGQRTGIMAQDLQAMPSTEALVQDTPEGLMVDGGGMASMALGATADQERRIQELEGELQTQLDATNVDEEEDDKSGIMAMLGGMMGG